MDDLRNNPVPSIPKGANGAKREQIEYFTLLYSIMVSFGGIYIEYFSGEGIRFNMN